MKWISNCKIWIRKFNTWTYFVTPWNMLWMLTLDIHTPTLPCNSKHNEQWKTEWEFMHFIFSSFSISFFRAQFFLLVAQSEGKFSLQFLYSSRAMSWIWRVPNRSYTKFNKLIIKTIRCVLCSVFIWKWFEILSVEGLRWKILSNTEHKILNFENTVYAQIKLITKLQVLWLWYVIHFHIHFTNTLNADYELFEWASIRDICMLYLLSVN